MNNHNRWDFGIYALVLDNKVVYIGYTHSAFQWRFNGHMDLEEKNSNPYVRELVENKIEFRLQPLISFKRELKDMISAEELRILEARLIKQHKPQFNRHIPKDKTIHFSN